jgi:hypothetical protein
MALKLKTEIDNTNLFADYYRIIDFSANYETQQLVIRLALYESQEARSEGKDPIKYTTHTLKLDNHYRELLYNKIRELEDFKNSTDI